MNKKHYLKISLRYAMTVFCDTFQISINVDVKSCLTKHDNFFFFNIPLVHVHGNLCYVCMLSVDT